MSVRSASAYGNDTRGTRRATTLSATSMSSGGLKLRREGLPRNPLMTTARRQPSRSPEHPRMTPASMFQRSDSLSGCPPERGSLARARKAWNVPPAPQISRQAGVLPQRSDRQWDDLLAPVSAATPTGDLVGVVAA